MTQARCWSGRWWCSAPTSACCSRSCWRCCLKCAQMLPLCAGALLERQMVVFCPNIGVLTAVVLALVPLMRPFAWQSLLLPVLPAADKMLDLLEAPVPFIFGIKARCHS